MKLSTFEIYTWLYCISFCLSVVWIWFNENNLKKVHIIVAAIPIINTMIGIYGFISLSIIFYWLLHYLVKIIFKVSVQYIKNSIKANREINRQNE